MTHHKPDGSHEHAKPEVPADPYQALMDAAPKIPKLLQEPVSIPGESPKADKPSGTGSLMEAGKAWGVALDFVFTVLAGLIIGWFIDRYLGAKPWGVLGGLAGGFILAFVRIVRNTQRAEAREKAARQAGRDPLK